MVVRRPIKGENSYDARRNYSDYAAVNQLKERGINPYIQTANGPVTNRNLVSDWWQSRNSAAGTGNYTNPTAARPKVNTGGGGGGGRGGGGGGGGTPPLDVGWLTSLLARSRPTDTAATNLDLPEFQGQFDPSVYNNLRQQWGQALDQSRGVGNQATQNLTNYLNTNYTNAFNNPNATYATQGQAPGMDQQAMARMLQSQGADPSINNANVQGAAAADQGFANLWKVLGANEDTAQRGRLTNAQIMNQDVQNRINAVGLQGTAGIGLQEGQARTAYDQMLQERNWQTAQQEAMANWERQNAVTDTNASNRNSYTNAQLQALLGLLPQLQAGGQMPDLNVLLGGAA